MNSLESDRAFAGSIPQLYEQYMVPLIFQPYAIALADRGLMALAGLWENWRSPAGEWVRSFAIITTTPRNPTSAATIRGRPTCSRTTKAAR